MRKEEYNNLIINKRYSELANISNISDLVMYQYNNHFLIEYLLEQGIHTERMDNMVKVHDVWIMFYVKYHLSKPLLSIHPKILLQRINGTLILDMVLSVLSYDESLLLLKNIKEKDYWSYHENEDIIFDIYKKYNFVIPKIFIHNSLISNSKNGAKMRTLINEFNLAYCDLDSRVLLILNNEINYGLKYDYENTYKDIKKLINYKVMHPNFIITLSNDTEGEYNYEEERIVISPFRRGVLFHELSHMLYEKSDNKCDDVITKYEEICSLINTKDKIDNITSYLKEFHQRYNDMRDYFVLLYQKNINKKYHSIAIYIETIYSDLVNNNVSFIDIKNSYNDGFALTISSDSIIDMIKVLIDFEREEYVNNELRNYYTEELMLENLLDAVLKGHIIENFLDIEGISGHSNLEFTKKNELSFDECLADYSFIKKSPKSKQLIGKLEELTSRDLITLLDNYLDNNRSKIRH